MKCLNGQPYTMPQVATINLKPGMVFTRIPTDGARFLVLPDRKYRMIRDTDHSPAQYSDHTGPGLGQWPIDLTMGAPLEDPKRMPV